MEALALTLADADFAHDFRWCRSRAGQRHLRWMPLGMPRLNPRFPNAAFFLYGRDSKTGEIAGPEGTGVFVILKRKRPIQYYTHIYAVTCHHLAPRGQSIIRINTKDGKSRFIEFEPHEWEFLPNGDDIAAIDVTDHINIDTDDFFCVPDRLFVSKEFATEVELGVGEDGFMLGLFANQAGDRRNLIAARFGNLSLLASDEAPIEQPNGQMRPSHIFDMRSRSGFSGSPVFVYRTPSADLRTATERGDYERIMRRRRNAPMQNILAIGAPVDPQDEEEVQEAEIRANTFVSLLGIHLGQYLDRIEIKKQKLQPEGNDIIREGDVLKIPGGMTIVAPAWEIMNLLNLPTFAEQREKREMRKLQEAHDKYAPPEPEALRPGEVSADASESAEHRSAQGEKGETPLHREDFTSLLNAAAKTRPQGD